MTARRREAGGGVRNQVQLIAYADRLGGSLAGLHRLLDGPLAGVFGGVHLLPFFTPYDGADAGFDPVDHTQVDSRLGTWDDVRALGQQLETMVDLIVNHVGIESAAFRDVRARGDASPSAGMFLTMDAVFPKGATEDDLVRLYRPRPGLPFTRMRLGGKDRLAWTTFTAAQVDLDVRSEPGAAYLRSVLSTLACAEVTTVRLDAVGYAVKTAGTTSFMTPGTYAFIDDLTTQARALGLEVLVEVHADPAVQQEVARRVDRVYDFALPPLVLHALLAADAAPLRRWLERRPPNAVTVLDTHDGIGVVDVVGLLEPEQIDALVEALHEGSGGTSRQATGAAASNLDLYQLNCTFYDALGGDDDRYLLARLIQLFVPGVPQVYYVGLLAGSNDMELLAATGVGRDVNRRHYTADQVTTELQRPVVARLLRALRWRNTHPAFDGAFAHRDDDGRLELAWQHGEHRATLRADLRDASYELSFTDAGRPPAEPRERRPGS